MNTTCNGKNLQPIVSGLISSDNLKGIERPTSMWASLTTRCLLFSWLCFGGLELLEQPNVMSEVEDLDEVALLQVASVLEPAISSHDTTYTDHTGVAHTVVEPTLWLSVHTIHQVGGLMVPSPPSLRLHQQLSVYRI